MTVLEQLKLLLEINDNEQDAKLTLYLSIAKDSILTRLYPYRDDKTEIPPKYNHIQVQIAQYLYLKEGAEGETSHNENGVSRTYENDYIPKSLLSQINPMCGGIK